jgi:hypothetical protein
VDFCHTIQVKALLDQLERVALPGIPAQSSFLSSSDEGDTEILSASDFPSSVRFNVEEDLIKANKRSFRPHHLPADQILTRTTSLVPISDVDHSNQLYRAKSYPQLLKHHGDKHVRFRCNQLPNMESTYSGISAIDSKPSRGVCWTSSGAPPIKSKEIYVNFSYIGGSRHNWKSKLSTTQEGDEQKGVEAWQSGDGSDVTLGQFNVAQNEGGFSLTASANGEIMGVSEVNSNVSTDPQEGDRLGVADKLGVGTNPSSRLSTKSDISLSLRSRLSLGVEHLSSLPMLTPQISVSPIESGITPPDNKPSSPQAGSARGTLRISSHSQRTKKRVTIPSNELESGVFSSTKYGPIVSAAESVTLSCLDSEQDITDVTSSTTIQPEEAPVQKTFIVW